ncbi:aspartyl/asparaginyl beta-hydroxylase-like [Latimeria chalumnae]|uniref:aspartyl/asparaginyl beta-hydroxylase-like n=1 Tax=Latimeria chalumnae TaxID=7897 RepID=UPI0006D93415|nr:PREDICTED: aspartyl/asparaginyl beta-hydroxylase-like [Latimeria chalumnae]|eukprot:XP_014349181.1 PREDICTED: aspartyl/asparaginyl beta-hydroxylase-like [Latimeria chalumnae]
MAEEAVYDESDTVEEEPEQEDTLEMHLEYEELDYADLLEPEVAAEEPELQEYYEEEIQEAAPVPEKDDGAAVPLPDPVESDEEPVEEVEDLEESFPYEPEETVEETEQREQESSLSEPKETAAETEYKEEETLPSEPEETAEAVEHVEESFLSEPKEMETQEEMSEKELVQEPEIHSETHQEDTAAEVHELREDTPGDSVTSPSEEQKQQESAGTSETEDQKQKEKAKKKKPKLLNKFDKTIKAELDAAEKLRKKGKLEQAQKAFEDLVIRYPQSPRARYGKAQTEDDLAEKMRSNDMLQRAINTYGEAADLPNAPTDLVKLALKRRAERQQFLGRIRGSLVTLQKLVQLFPDDVSLKNDFGVGYLLLGDNSNAKKVYEEVLSIAPHDGFAKVHYGFILKAENKIAESIPFLKEGLESGDPGTDDGRFYFHLGDALQRVGDEEAYKWYELGHKRGHFASMWQRSLYNVDGLKAQPWWTAKETGYTDLVKALERNWKLVRDEGLAVMDTEKGLFLPEDENLREKGDWGQFTLWQQGKKNENSCKQVPKTCTLMERFPESTGCKRGQIKYSIMKPGTHVWPHTGPTNCRLRMHLGLVIPKEGCRIRCTNDTRTWEEGKVLIFDDSFEHEVWQDASSFRLIFIVDVWHPELTPHQRRTLSPI